MSGKGARGRKVAGSGKDAGLRLKGMTLGDGTRWVVQDLDLAVARGALHMILGERDTGKTALLEGIAGLRSLERGEVEVEGKAALIPQAIPPAQIRVLDRLLLRTQPRYLGMGIRWRAAREQARALAARFGIEPVLDVSIEALRPLERRLVELAVAISEEPGILLLDEPTSDLGPHEAQQFLAAVKAAAVEEKIPAVYTSSRPRDAYPEAAGATILWRGADPATVTTAECTEAALVEKWTGGAGIRQGPSGPHTAGDALMRVEDLVLPGRGRETALAGIEFEIKAGEVLAIVGAPADGLNLLHDALLGSRSAERGSIHFLGKEMLHSTRRHRVESGISFVNPPHARDQSIPEFSIEENLILGQVGGPPFARGGFLRHDSIRGNAVRTLRDFEIPEAKPEDRFRDLGLGDRQRIIVAREVIRNPVLLIARSPAQGLSLEAQEFVRRTLVLQCERGSGLLWLTEEPEEAMRVADRLAVLAAGRLVWIPVTETMTRERIVDEMSGAAA
jgi:simple sugar transport system ATP-binding protein